MIAGGWGYSESQKSFNATIENTVTKKSLLQGLVVKERAHARCVNVLPQGSRGAGFKTEGPGGHLLLQSCKSTGNRIPYKEKRGSIILRLVSNVDSGSFCGHFLNPTRGHEGGGVGGERGCVLL